MKRILIFAGTTEGRKLSEYLETLNAAHLVCVATEYGEIVMHPGPFAEIHPGRMSEEEIRSFILQKQVSAVVDATHPFASLVTKNIKAAMEGMDIPYLRLVRAASREIEYDGVRYFEKQEDCIQALEETQGNILLTTGSKELAAYASREGIKNRLFVRVLPGMDSIRLCMEQGILGKQILAMQGPFSTELNAALIRQFQIRHLVTKQSGANSGYEEKLLAAKETGISVYVIQREITEEGGSFEDICGKLRAFLFGEEAACPDSGLSETAAVSSSDKTQKERRMEITLAGIGMGGPLGVTQEVKQAIEEADFLFGAERMIAPYCARLEKRPYYLAEDIIGYLQQAAVNEALSNLSEDEPLKAVVLFSGDSGFYSGSKKLYERLQEAVKQGTLNAAIRILPGISSVSYLASRLGVSYQDAAVLSIHGKKAGEWESEVLAGIKSHRKTFLLLSGAEDVRRLSELLLKHRLGETLLMLGRQLSYPEESICQLTPKEGLALTEAHAPGDASVCGKSKGKEKGLYTCMVYHAAAKAQPAAHGIPDEAFLRGKVPMTKEEVREVSICKLHLKQDSVVYDVGSGTGSIAMEIAGLSPGIRIYAIERKPEAAALIAANRETFGAYQVNVVEAEAPEGFEQLPQPTNAFIGGSGGNMAGILKALYRKNPGMRVVINAITLETVGQVEAEIKKLPVENVEIVQLQVNRGRKAGPYHLMQAENPVWIFSFNFTEGKPEGSVL